MKKLLFLDDDANRHKRFNEAFSKGAHVSHVWTADQCCRALASGVKWHTLFLDHDLQDFCSDEGWARRMAGCGMDVVHFIEDDLPKELIPEHILIHSWNDTKAPIMEAKLLKVTPNVKRVEFKW